MCVDCFCCHLVVIGEVLHLRAEVLCQWRMNNCRLDIVHFQGPTQLDFNIPLGECRPVVPAQ
jgi:hypothetical protein